MTGEGPSVIVLDLLTHESRKSILFHDLWTSDRKAAVGFQSLREESQLVAGEDFSDLEVLPVTWGAIGASCHQRGMKGRASLLFLSFTYQLDTHFFRAKGREAQGPMLVSL